LVALSEALIAGRRRQSRNFTVEDIEWGVDMALVGFPEWSRFREAALAHLATLYISKSN
jgi:hypothetical protein